jgi:UDP-3-O-acyl-N-acetylglucosamine deacetylase
MGKNQLEAMLLTYNLTSTVNFPTRCQKNSATAIDNIFINTDRKNDYHICPIINGLSDHDAQLITLKGISLKPPTKQIMEIRKFVKNSINDFLNKLSYETWDITFSSKDVNIMFNAFLDTNLKIFTPASQYKKYKLLLKGMNGLHQE